MKFLFLFCSFILLVQQTFALPIKHAAKDEQPKEEIEKAYDLEYNRYLEEVETVLESDPEFREKLIKAKDEDFESGKIAHELAFVNQHVRSKLDEIKRQEVERLRHLATKAFESENGLDIEHLKIPEHLDNENPHTFEFEDLKKLMVQSAKDMKEIDGKRRIAFKEYEMQKKFEQEQKLKELDGELRKKYKEEIQKTVEKHKKHEPLHHPGSKQQFEEVWEKEDHMETQEFNPKTFFYLHDIDGNGFWDQNELKALFLRDLDKVYAKDDLIEKAEEMERMGESAFKDMDINKDELISLKEYLRRAEDPKYDRDEGWEILEEQEIYSNQEYEEFKKRREEGIKKKLANTTGNAQESAPRPEEQVLSHGQAFRQ